MTEKPIQELIEHSLCKFKNNQTILADKVGMRRVDVCRYANGYFDNPKLLSILPLFRTMTNKEIVQFIRKHGGKYVAS
jgi:hypothetical protein